MDRGWDQKPDLCGRHKWMALNIPTNLVLLTLKTGNFYLLRFLGLFFLKPNNLVHSDIEFCNPNIGTIFWRELSTSILY